MRRNRDWHRRRVTRRADPRSAGPAGPHRSADDDQRRAGHHRLQKTARSRWSQGQAENTSSQLLLYSELARRLLPDREVRLRFLVLTKTRTPTVEAFNVGVSTHCTHRIVKAVEHTWRAIEAGHFYPAPSPMNCPTCPYRSECNAWPGN
ncbi:MAG: PD-(D/E)XK nuclease family protein [Rhodopirellula sp.]|nr:PD-(D/E)XK nuclease family protein [Rhodopirellula sp.]